MTQDVRQVMVPILIMLGFALAGLALQSVPGLLYSLFGMQIATIMIMYRELSKLTKITIELLEEIRKRA